MFGLGTQELLIIAAIVFVIFGINKLPKIGRDLGQSIKEFRKAAKELTDTVDHEGEE
jgi:sec-independent protein translocase protein TatA